MAENVVSWALKLQTGQFRAPAAGVVADVRKIAAVAESAVPAVADMGAAMTKAAADASKLAGAYQDAAGRWHAASGKFLKRSDITPEMAAQAQAVAKVRESATSAAPAVANIGDALSDAAAGAAKFTEETKASADAVAGIAGSYRDAAGRLRAANGRFLSGKEIADAAAASIGAVGDAAAGAASKVGSLSDQFDALQKSAKFDANKVLEQQSIARGLAHLKALRAASRAAAAPTDAEKMMAGAMPDHLKPVQRLGLAQRAMRKFMQQFSMSTGGRGLAAIGSLTSRLEKAAPVIDGLREAATKAAPVLKSLGSAALTAGAAGAAIAAGLGAAAGGFAYAVLKTQAAREGIEGALIKLTKSRKAAKEVLELSARTADMLGQSRQEVAGQFVDLLAKGFNPERVNEIVKSLADLSTVDPKADLERLTRTIGQIAGTGRLQGDELNELANAGLETGAVYDAIAKNLGKTRAEIIKLKEAGKIDSDTAIQGIIDAIGTQVGGGPAGLAALTKSRTTITGLMKLIENGPGNLLYSIDVKGNLETIKGTLAGVAEFFDLSTAKGDMLASTVETVFGALVEGFLGTTGEQGAKGLTTNIEKLLNSLKASAPEIKQFAAQARKIADFGVSLIDIGGQFLAFKEKVSGAVDSLGMVGSVLSFAFMGPMALAKSAVFALAGAIGEITTYGFDGWIEGIAIQIAAFGIRLFNAASELGTRIIDGITSGISAGLSRVTESISTVANGAIGEAKAILGIRSPSKVFEEIGMYTAMGFERGIAANDTGALADLIAPPSPAQIAAGAGVAAAAAGGAGGAPIQVNVNVDAKGATAADAQRIGEMVAEQVRITLENMAIGLGAAA